MTAPELLAEEQPPALKILGRGFRESPELRKGIGVTVTFALLSALARLVLPVLVQQAIDGGFVEGEVDTGFVTGAAIAAAVLVLVIYALTVVTFRRVVVTAENTLLALRVRTFAHIQRCLLYTSPSPRDRG